METVASTEQDTPAKEGAQEMQRNCETDSKTKVSIERNTFPFDSNRH